jgi:hypothetical protein
MGGRSPSDIAHFMEGLEFPASKEELVTYAEDNNAPQEVIDILEHLPDQDYSSITDIIFGISLVE